MIKPEERMFKKSNNAKNGLNIIIVGCGKVGITLIEQLVKEGHDITVIDKNPQTMQAISNLYDVMTIVGNGASYGVQMEAGIEKADLIIAVTGSDELNLLCCTVARRVGKCAGIARVITPDYSEDVGYLRSTLGLAMIINPELETASEIARVLYLPTALEINTFAHGQAEMIKISVPEGTIMDGKTIAAIGSSIPVNFLICAVERDGEVYIPSGDFVIKTGDLISFTASRRNVREFLRKTGYKTNRVKDTMIIGGGKSAYYLAKQLLQMGIDVKIIERDMKRCEELSLMLPDAVIINGDGTNEDLLLEEGIDRMDSFVPLTGIDEENVLLTLHAKSLSDIKPITKINRITFKNVISDLELGSVIYPKYLASEAIIAYVRAKTASMNSSNIETLYHMFDSRVEAIEFKIDKESAVTGKPLKELKLKDNLRIALITRRGKVRIPKGDDCISLGDTVVVVTKHTGFDDIEDILAER